ncbi:MAG: RNA polymerase sigma factor [Enterobacterales bacterium]|nr:RNA polymerase sigma factor [Enterobacterales bacterium]
MSQSLKLNKQKTFKRFEISCDELSDKKVVLSILDGNPDDYGYIMKRYNQKMYRVARSIVKQSSQAMDIVQESHLKAFNKLNQLDSDLKILPWLCSITRNQALMYLRKQKLERSMNVIDIHSLDDSNSDTDARSHKEKSSMATQDFNPEENAENQQLKTLIEQTIDTLPEDFRLVFVLRGVEHFSLKETAEILSIEIVTVKTRYFRAKKLLQQKIQHLLSQQNMQVYEIGGIHCDQIIQNVLLQLNAHSK